VKKKRTVTKEYMECDGCKYLMGEGPMITVSVPFDYPWEYLRDDRQLEFHFHALQQRHDCFRYWAHNPRIMRDSLKDRELDNEEIDEFMSLMLYRERIGGPGVEREKKTAA
jgi:hypothetical protein